MFMEACAVQQKTMKSLSHKHFGMIIRTINLDILNAVIESHAKMRLYVMRLQLSENLEGVSFSWIDESEEQCRCLF